MSDVLARANRALLLVALAISAITVLAVMFMIIVDIGSRFLFNRPVPGAYEVVENMMVVIVFLAFAWVQASQGNIRVSIVTDRLSLTAQEILEAFACLIGTVLFGLVVWKAGELGLYSLQIREVMPGPVPYPLYPFKLVLPLGCALLCLQFARSFVASVQRLNQRRRGVA